MIDTHTHIYDTAFDEDFSSVVSRAKGAGLKGLILPSIDSTYYDRMIKCHESIADFSSMAIGLHPTSVKGDWKNELAFMESKIDKENFVAIGEIGIDRYWSKEYISEQKEVFLRQINLATERGLPIIIHAREATEEIFNVLDIATNQTGRSIKGVFHAYSGSYDTYKRIKSFGNFKVGIGGVATYKNASIATSLQSIPLEDIVLETDSPWLTPVPFRGKRNEPSYLIYVVEKIASIKGITSEEVIETTTQNTRSLFKL